MKDITNEKEIQYIAIGERFLYEGEEYEIKESKEEVCMKICTLRRICGKVKIFCSDFYRKDRKCIYVAKAEE